MKKDITSDDLDLIRNELKTLREELKQQIKEIVVFKNLFISHKEFYKQAYDCGMTLQNTFYTIDYMLNKKVDFMKNNFDHTMINISRMQNTFIDQDRNIRKYFRLANIKLDFVLSSLNKEKIDVPTILDLPIDMTLFNIRIRALLKNNNIILYKDLTSKSQIELLKTPNFGKRSLDLIRLHLKEFGLSLKDD